MNMIILLNSDYYSDQRDLIIQHLLICNGRLHQNEERWWLTQFL